MLYIFDIDGVLADVTHFLYLITGENKDFDAYYARIGEAKPIWLGKQMILTIFDAQRQAKETVNTLKSRQDPRSNLWSSVGGVTINPEAISFFEPKGLYFVTGRKESSRRATKEWLIEQGITTNKKLEAVLTQYEVGKRKGKEIDLKLCEKTDTAWGDYVHLYMRSNKDFRPAHEVKHDIIQRISKETGVPFSDMVVFEDDPQCAKMYESLGCYVCHVRHEKAKS
jgi:hypothetical protein